jgi:hypothetical protein
MTALVQRRPWLVAALGAAGVTLCGAAGFALFAPLPLLERASALGDARLGGILAAGFAAGLLLCRLLLVRRRLPEERVDEAPARAQRHLR